MWRLATSRACGVGWRGAQELDARERLRTLLEGRHRFDLMRLGFARLLGCHDLVRRRELLGGGVEGNEETCDTYE